MVTEPVTMKVTFTVVGCNKTPERIDACNDFMAYEGHCSQSYRLKGLSLSPKFTDANPDAISVEWEQRGLVGWVCEEHLKKVSKLHNFLTFEISKDIPVTWDWILLNVRKDDAGNLHWFEVQLVAYTRFSDTEWEKLEKYI